MSLNKVLGLTQKEKSGQGPKVSRVVSNRLKALLQVICCELLMESNVDVKELRFTIGLHFGGGSTLIFP